MISILIDRIAGHDWRVVYTWTGRDNDNHPIDIVIDEAFRDDEPFDGELPPEVKDAVYQQAQEEYWRNRR